MHAYLIVNGDALAVENKAKELQAKIFEFKLAKVEDTRELNNITRLKVTEKTAIAIYDFNKASEETQNAFLKSLEEPQENLYYILTADSTDNILPTILSRCEVIERKQQDYQIKDAEFTLIDEFFEGTIGEKLMIISKLNKREDALTFTDNLIIIGHSKINSNVQIYKILEGALNLKRGLMANGNVQLQLTNFVVNLALN